MGYYTQYEVTVSPDFPDDLDAALKQFSGGYSFYSGDSQESIKWYEHEKNMRALSHQYPAHLFTVTGEGEESGDLWIKYFRDGKMQACKGEVIYPPMDESKFA